MRSSATRRSTTTCRWSFSSAHELTGLSRSVSRIATSLAPRPPRLFLCHVLFHVHLSDFGAIDIPPRINSDAFSRTRPDVLGLRVGDEVLHLAVFQTADPNPSEPPARMRRRVVGP